MYGMDLLLLAYLRVYLFGMIIMLSISLSTLYHSITNRTLRVTSGASQVLLAGVSGIYSGVLPCSPNLSSRLDMSETTLQR